MNKTDVTKLESRWPHRTAVALVCATFPLICLGGLVTSYKAGMAVPDWPSTYGYNLFLYPPSTWFFGPWDIFIEHGHRLLGALVGIIAIVLLVVVFKTKSASYVKYLATAALVLVICQGLLGGLRVVENSREIARLHACVAPLFFSVAVSLAVVTSRFWRDSRQSSAAIGSSQLLATRRLYRYGIALGVLTYCQLVIGAHLRHVSDFWAPGTFHTVVWFHVLFAMILVVQITKLAWQALRANHLPSPIRRPALTLGALVVVQVALGLATWIAKYSFPFGGESMGAIAQYTVVADGFMQGNIVTAHVAVGALMLAYSVQFTLRVRSLLPVSETAPESFRPLIGQEGALA